MRNVFAAGGGAAVAVGTCVYDRVCHPHGSGIHGGMRGGGSRGVRGGLSSLEENRVSGDWELSPPVPGASFEI